MDCTFGENMGLEFPNTVADSELGQNTQSVAPKNEIENEPESESDSEPESEYLSKIEHLEWCMKNIEGRQRKLEDSVNNYYIGLIIAGIAIYFAGFAIQSVGR